MEKLGDRSEGTRNRCFDTPIHRLNEISQLLFTWAAYAPFLLLNYLLLLLRGDFMHVKPVLVDLRFPFITLSIHTSSNYYLTMYKSAQSAARYSIMIPLHLLDPHDYITVMTELEYGNIQDWHHNSDAVQYMIPSSITLRKLRGREVNNGTIVTSAPPPNGTLDLTVTFRATRYISGHSPHA